MEDGRWHLDKKVPVAFIVVLLGYGIAGMWFIADIKKDVELLKAQAPAQVQRDDRQDKAVSESVAVIRAQLDRIDANILQLIREGSKR
ncbi:MAG TPA: hypothetical protein PLN55_09950 [Burkholderiaceae bacterium]|nr:hypothetical protein [Burkholderiaceae bacterium]